MEIGDAYFVRAYRAVIGQCCYSSITYAELFSWQGLNDTDRQSLKALLADINRLPINDDVIDTSINIRLAHKIKLLDALILATSRVYSLKILTFDERLKKIDEQVRTICN